MTQSKITIYSNGVADLKRTYVVRSSEPCAIAIPVRRDHLGDVLASLSVFGAVKLAAPPSYRPSNDAAGSLTLDANNVLEDLARQLTGARVAVDRAGGSSEGTLVGLHVEPEGKLDERTFPKSIVVLTSDGLMKVALKDVVRLRFLDEAAREELDKALRRAFQQIKPNSTFVELTLTTTESEAEAVLQYTIPAAAWKIAYRLRETDDSYELHGFAIVDNNTDESWRDFIVAVVQGDPITFSTDLAESKSPRRRHVNVVRASAVGAVEVEASVDAMLCDFEDSDEDDVCSSPPSPMMRSMSAPAYAGGRSEVRAQSRSAAAPAVETTQIGDFAIYESVEPVTIEANRSAAIPVLQVALSEAKTVLYHPLGNEHRQLYRAVRFKNETPQPLGRGVCTIFQGGTYAGNCVMPPTPAAGTAMLVHALESGVVVQLDRPSQTRRQTGLSLSNGIAVMTEQHTSETVYRLNNRKAEAFDVIIDHQWRLPGATSKVTAILKQGQCESPIATNERLSEGHRLSVSLAANATAEVVVRESRIDSSRMVMVGSQRGNKLSEMYWFEEQFGGPSSPVHEHAGLCEFRLIQQRLAEKQSEITKATSKVEQLSKRQERLRKNIGTGGQDEQTANWRHELGQEESRINTLEEQTLPQLRREEDSIQKELEAAMLALSVEWSAGPDPGLRDA